MRFDEKIITIGGNSITYFDEGKPDAPPVIFIHGFPFNKSMWEYQIEVLKDHYRVIAFDVRGHGNADSGKGEFSIVEFAKDLFLFMDALHLDKTTLCGLSMGGYIALTAMQQKPERITSLILCDTQCAADSEEGRKKRMDTIQAIRENGLTAYASDSVKKLFSPYSLANKKDMVKVIEQTILQTKPQTIIDTLMALAGRKETCSSLPALELPVLILVGKEDQITTPEAAQKMHDLLPNSSLQVIDQAGHLSNLENPESFNHHVNVFLGTLQNK